MAGTVIEVGDGVTEWAPGDRVLNAPFRMYPAGALRSEWVRTFVGGNGVDGILAERILYPAESLVRIPASYSFVEGSTLTIAGLTAWAAVVTHGRTRPGDWVVVHGTGGVSVFAAQIARMLGAGVILTTSSPRKAEWAREHLGVADTFDYRSPDWPTQVREATGGNGADVVVEVAGGECLAQSMRACGYGGRVAVIGVLAGAETKIRVRDLLSRQISVKGIFMESTAELRALARALDQNNVRPHVDRVFPFDETHLAYAHLQSQQHVGKVVIAMNPEDATPRAGS
jgi:NADPH:quinone reductase-like Zn-dependent oxidoreductase